MVMFQMTKESDSGPIITYEETLRAPCTRTWRVTNIPLHTENGLLPNERECGLQVVVNDLMLMVGHQQQLPSLIDTFAFVVVSTVEDPLKSPLRHLIWHQRASTTE